MTNPTVGQLEREISNRLRKLYNIELEKRSRQVICHFFDSSIAITIENSITQVEQTLIREGHENLAAQVRCDLEKIIQPKVKELIEEVIKKPVRDLINHTSRTTGSSGIIVLLQELPDVRNPESIPKANLKSLAG